MLPKNVRRSRVLVERTKVITFELSHSGTGKRLASDVSRTPSLLSRKGNRALQAGAVLLTGSNIGSNKAAIFTGTCSAGGAFNGGGGNGGTDTHRPLKVVDSGFLL